MEVSVERLQLLLSPLQTSCIAALQLGLLQSVCVFLLMCS